LWIAGRRKGEDLGRPANPQPPETRTATKPYGQRLKFIAVL
jgi:hypothetical protein